MSVTLQTSARRCTCGAEHDPDAHKYIGPMPAGSGEVLLLGNASCCGTTYTVATLQDAAVCIGVLHGGKACGHVIFGDAEDPKTMTADGALCADCAETDMRVPRVRYRGRVRAA